MENPRFKFRAWDKENESYIGYEYPPRYTDIDELYGDIEEIYIEGIYKIADDDNYVLEQCTGLKDKNGKLIYDGDFLDYKGEVCLVFWSEPTACFGVMLQDSGYTDYAGDIKRSDLYSIDAEIIGNIHKNPELLKEFK